MLKSGELGEAPLWPSLSLLDETCDRWFLSKFGQIAWIPSTKRSHWTPTKEITDIVLVGRMHEEILEHDSWPGEKFRLWAMGSAARNVRLQVNQIRPEHLGYLPRYELFPAKYKPSKFPASGEEWSLVFCGRVKEDKGFSYFLKLASSLQNDFGEKVHPVIYAVLERGKSDEAREETNRVKKLLGELPWKKRPDIWVGLGHNEWIEKPLVNPVLFNFSVFLNDDFSVSSAQAQAQGWPLLLSDWGGHRDVVGENVRRFCVDRLKVMTSSSFPVKDDAAEILKMMRESFSTTPVLEGVSIPQVVDHAQLEEYAKIMRAQNVQVNGPWPKKLEIETEKIFSGPGWPFQTPAL